MISFKLLKLLIIIGYLYSFYFWKIKVDKGVRGVLIFMFRVYIWEG